MEAWITQGIFSQFPLYRFLDFTFERRAKGQVNIQCNNAAGPFFILNLHIGTELATLVGQIFVTLAELTLKCCVILLLGFAFETAFDFQKRPEG